MIVLVLLPLWPFYQICQLFLGCCQPPMLSSLLYHQSHLLEGSFVALELIASEWEHQIEGQLGEQLSHVCNLRCFCMHVCTYIEILR